MNILEIKPIGPSVSIIQEYSFFYIEEKFESKTSVIKSMELTLAKGLDSEGVITVNNDEDYTIRLGGYR